ncbi:MAG: ribulose-phosphate 3-epimerase [Bacteroidales bacterium]|jgi:ribulose-phosphate 3-epimerase|nr:ribulose-phosphate 3-epimerase [Bacteroidales bacterium]MDD4215555.1 ribulose-phosphate 3-epimerase [Bacteroidales bacterium]
MSHLISPSILSADFGYLREQIEIINGSEADFIHIDVMDGVFVPNISFGFTVLDSLKGYIGKPFDIHLMIMDPDRYIARFAEYKPAYLTIHFESAVHLHRSIDYIQSFNIKAGLAINPHTTVNMLAEIIQKLDLLLIMSVNPGFGGQKFIMQTLAKIEKAKKLITDMKSDCKIQVDGGIDINNIKNVVKAGADIVVAGNAIFKSDDITKAVEQLKNVNI